MAGVNRASRMVVKRGGARRNAASVLTHPEARVEGALRVIARANEFREFVVLVALDEAANFTLAQGVRLKQRGVHFRVRRERRAASRTEGFTDAALSQSLVGRYSGGSDASSRARWAPECGFSVERACHATQASTSAGGE